MKAGEALVAIDKKVNQMRRSALKARESALSDNVADYKRWEQLTIAEWNSRVKREWVLGFFHFQTRSTLFTSLSPPAA